MRLDGATAQVFYSRDFFIDQRIEGRDIRTEVGFTPMLELCPAKPDEFDSGLKLMKINMSSALADAGFSLDEDWNRSNYAELDNYSVFRQGRWIGFVSIEITADPLFVHTVQLIPEVHGNTLGMKLFRWIRDKATAANRRSVRCRALNGSRVLDLYARLGFVIEKSGPALVEMALSLDD